MGIFYLTKKNKKKKKKIGITQKRGVYKKKGLCLPWGGRKSKKKRLTILLREKKKTRAIKGFKKNEMCRVFFANNRADILLEISV